MISHMELSSYAQMGQHRSAALTAVTRPEALRVIGTRNVTTAVTFRRDKPQTPPPPPPPSSCNQGITPAGLPGNFSFCVPRTDLCPDLPSENGNVTAMSCLFRFPETLALLFPPAPRCSEGHDLGSMAVADMAR